MVKGRQQRVHNDDATPHPIPFHPSSISSLICIVVIPRDQYPAVSSPLLYCVIGCAEQGHLPTMALEDTTTWVLQRKIIIKQQQAVLDLCPPKLVVVVALRPFPVPVSQFLINQEHSTQCECHKEMKKKRHRRRLRISRCTVFVFNHHHSIRFGMRLCPDADVMPCPRSYAEIQS